MADSNSDLVGEVPASGLICVACGEAGATDLGEDTVLCRVCSGEEALAEARTYDWQ